MLLDLAAAGVAEAGGKARPLAVLIRHGIAVPAGFVVPTSVFQRVLTDRDPALLAEPGAREELLGSARGRRLQREIETALRASLGNRAEVKPVAVRSSATDEDTPGASAAGQHDTFLDVCGTTDVCDAILRCWASLSSARARAYRDRRSGEPAPRMAVLVQRFVDAEVSGVLFSGDHTMLEAAPGSGERIVAGRITPDAWMVTDGAVHAHRPSSRGAPMCLKDRQVRELASLGRRIATILGGPTDIEFAIDHGQRIHVLQARPISAALPALRAAATSGGELDVPSDDVPTADVPSDGPRVRRLHGTAASAGRARGVPCVVHGPDDFAAFLPGGVLVCAETDPAWTPLLRVASAVVTETGGVLCHAAIVARELGIPAVLAVADATRTVPMSGSVTVDGDAGIVCCDPI